MNDPATVHRQDQEGAAARESAAIFDNLQWALPGGGRKFTTDGNPPEWLVRLGDRHNKALAADPRACEHLADGRPGARVVLAWWPGVLLCPRCVAAMDPLPDDAPEERTCDGCDTFYPEGLKLIAIQVRPDTTFHAFACDNCMAELGLTA
ncbi:MAG TPA: hypothetical protein VFB06_34480 [Streptosporangiaceae bacterium]|nr:hypothetical protein [Streptosporangiaceae bacterium]